MKKIQYIALAALLALTPAFVLAQTTVTAGAVAGGAATSTPKLTAAEQKAKQRADQEIQRRITALNGLLTRISQMQEVSDSFKQGLTANVQTEISTLTALQQKIDADTDLATLKTDVQSITKSYRVYALVLPQSRIAAASDRIVTLVSMFTSLGGKLQTRLQEAASGGQDVSALTAALTDIQTKITDAQTQAQNAVTSTAGLQPDNGDKTAMANNDAALKAARADIVAAQKDLVAARADVKTILTGLGKLSGGSAGSASSTIPTPAATPAQ